MLIKLNKTLNRKVFYNEIVASNFCVLILLACIYLAFVLHRAFSRFIIMKKYKNEIYCDINLYIFRQNGQISWYSKVSPWFIKSIDYIF